LYFGSFQLDIEDAAVHDGEDQETILFGLTDWVRNKVEFKSDNDFQSQSKIMIDGTPVESLWKYVDKKDCAKWHSLSRE